MPTRLSRWPERFRAYVTIETAPGVGKSLTFTLFKNSSATALTCTISDNNLTASDVAHSVTVAVGDLLAWEQAPSGTPATSTNIVISAKFVGSVAGESPIYAGGNITSMATGAASYSPLCTNGSWGATEAVVSSLASPPGVIDKLYVLLTGTPGSAKSYALTLYKNGSPTALTCTVSDLGTSANDTTHSVTVAAGDTLSIESVPSGTPTARLANIGMRFVPTTAGESMISVSGVAPSQSASRWYRPNEGTGNGQTTAATTIESIAPVAFTLKNLYTAMSTAAGSAKSRTSRSYINAGYGTLTAAMSGTSQVSNNDTTHTDSLVQGDAFWMATDPASTPAAVTWYKIGGTVYIAP